VALDDVYPYIGAFVAVRATFEGARPAGDGERQGAVTTAIQRGPARGIGTTGDYDAWCPHGDGKVRGARVVGDYERGITKDFGEPSERRLSGEIYRSFTGKFADSGGDVAFSLDAR
jgi:hypothetical protein